MYLLVLAKVVLTGIYQGKDKKECYRFVPFLLFSQLKSKFNLCSIRNQTSNQ